MRKWIGAPMIGAFGQVSLGTGLWPIGLAVVVIVWLLLIGDKSWGTPDQDIWYVA